MNPQTIILIGPSGSGKGTQATLLREYLEQHDPGRDVLYVQVGKRFRDLAEGRSLTADLVRGYIEAGALAPEFLTVWAWGNILIDALTGNEHLLFDGTPRKFEEAKILHEALRFYKRENVTVVSLVVSKDKSRERLQRRGRKDDDPRDIERRLAWYDTEVVPAIDFFKKQQDTYRVVEVDGEQDINGVHRAIVDAIA